MLRMMLFPVETYPILEQMTRKPTDVLLCPLKYSSDKRKYILGGIKKKDHLSGSSKSDVIHVLKKHLRENSLGKLVLDQHNYC